MATPNQTSSDGAVGRFIVTALILWAVITFQPGPYADPLHTGLWWFGVAIAGIGILRLIPPLFGGLGNGLKFLRAVFGKDTVRGSAGWLTEKDLRKAGLHRRKRGSRFAGVLGASPIFLRTETHHLVLGPAGTQKSTSVIINILCGSAESALVNDVKGELFEVTGGYRAKVLGHKVLKIDPRDPENSAKVNVLDFIHGFIEQNSPEALTLVRGMALQLYPEPSGGNDQNKFFRDGSRILLVTVVLVVIVTLPPKHRHMASVFRMLSDMGLLHDALLEAAKSPALHGEVASMASAAHASAFGEDAAGKTFEQFRLGALQAVTAFGPGNYLAPITSETTLSFADLKKEEVTVYQIIDYANKDVLGQFSGLMQWLAAYQLVGVGNNKPVLFVLDEFCNSPLHILPTILTLLRTYGVKCILATQDLDDIVRTYSKHALESVLSETDIKQFLGGIRSQSTLEYLSKYLGEFTETTPSYSLGKGGVQESLSRTNRRLLSEDEIRRLDKGAQIILASNLRPILARKVQVFSIAPYRKRIAGNSLYGGKRMLLPVEVRIGWLRTVVTSRGRRAYSEIKRSVSQRKRGNWLRMLEFCGNGLSFAPAVFAAAGIGFLLWTYGLPSLRWEYAYAGSRHAPGSYIWCRYIGPVNPGIIRSNDCPLILFHRTW